MIFIEFMELCCCFIKLRPTVGYCCRQGIHCCVRPQPLLNKDIKVKDNKQKPKDACPARTAADKRTAAEDNNVL